MELNLEEPRSNFTVRRVESESVVVGAQTLHHSFVLTPSRLIEGWPASRVEEIDAQLVEQLFGLEPEVVLLGSGNEQQFAPPEVQASLLRRGIGLECMDNAACARTYNLLANEGRRVVAVFLIP